MVGKIELQACVRDYHQSNEGFAELDRRTLEKYGTLKPLYIEAGFSGIENFGGNQTVAYSKQRHDPFYFGRKSFKNLGKPTAEKFVVHGLIREESLNGYSACDNDIAKLFFEKIPAIGNSVRIFSGANNFEVVKRQIELAKEQGLHVQVDISIQGMGYNVDKLKEYACLAVDYGADQINYKSHSGSANLEVLKELTQWMDETLPKKIKFGYHTHCTYGNAYKEIETFIGAIDSSRDAIIHTGLGKGLSDGMAQPDPNEIIRMFPDKVVYNKEGMDKVNQATKKLSAELSKSWIGVKDLQTKLL